MTQDPFPPEKYRLLEKVQSPHDRDQTGDDKDDSPPRQKNQCLDCPWSGPIVDAEWEYTDPRIAVYEKRQAAFERLLEKFKDEKLIGVHQAVEYLNDQRRRNCRPNTMRSSAKSIELFLALLSKRGKSHLNQITRDDIFAFIEHQQDCKLKPVTVNTRLRGVKAFCRFLIDAELIDVRVLSRKITIKVPEPLPRAMEPDDEKRLLSVLTHVRNRAMILVLLRTGMRIGELLDTRMRDVSMDCQRIEIYEAEKTRIGRVVYFSDDARSALQAWFDVRDRTREVVFYGLGNEALTYQGARAVFKKALIAAELDHKGYALHCLRHTFATSLLNAGMRLECLQQLLGHSSVEMTRRYARLTDKTREEEYFRAMAIIERGQADEHD